MTTLPDYDIRVERPDGWFDRSMIIYAAKSKGGFEANVVIARDALVGGESFDDYALRQRKTFKDNLPGCKILGTQEGDLNDYEAHEITFSWQSGTGKLRQRALFVSIGRNRMVTFAATAADDDFDSMVPQFDEILATLKIEDTSGDGTTPQFTN